MWPARPSQGHPAQCLQPNYVLVNFDLRWAIFGCTHSGVLFTGQDATSILLAMSWQNLSLV